MSGFPLFAPLGLYVALLFSTALAAAECEELKQFLGDETAGAEKYIDMFTVRRDPPWR